MITLAELELQAMELSGQERAKLASKLLSSLPPLLEDDDEGVAEAMRRREEMEADPASIISLEQLKKSIGR